MKILIYLLLILIIGCNKNPNYGGCVHNNKNEPVTDDNFIMSDPCDDWDIEDTFL